MCTCRQNNRTSKEDNYLKSQCQTKKHKLLKSRSIRIDRPQIEDKNSSYTKRDKGDIKNTKEKVRFSSFFMME